jgi:ABC-type uncharacterized transport system substrate-binding protein
MSFHDPEMMAKRLEVLKSALPRLGRAGVLLNPNNPLNGSVLQRLEQTARALNVEWHPIDVRAPTSSTTRARPWRAGAARRSW